ncbi:hypothetical protein F5878DRAFT_341616, partial [Lentinula raphanica]
INPLDPEIFTEADYAPSIPTSTETHLPKSFPRRLHRAPDVGSDDASFDPVVLLARAESRMEEQGETDESDDTEYSPSESSESDLSSDSDSTSPTSVIMPSLPTPSPALPAMRHTRSRTVTPTSSLSFNSASSSFRSQLFSNEIENLRRENALLRVQNAHLAEDNDRIAEQRNAAEAHAILIGQQYSIANYRLNQKKKKNDTSKRVSTSARILTSAEAQQEFAEAAARKAEEQRAKDLKQQQKDEQNRADILRRAEQELTQATFSGSLKSLNKSTLIDIAFALKVEYDGASAGTLRARLNAHFDANEDLKQDPRFIGLFQRKRKRKDPPKENEDSESSLLPPTHRRRTENHRSPTPGPSSILNSDSSRSSIRHFGTQNASLLNPPLIPPSPFNLQLPTSLYQGPYLSTVPHDLIETPSRPPHPRPRPRPLPRPLPRTLPPSSSMYGTNVDKAD